MNQKLQKYVRAQQRDKTGNYKEQKNQQEQAINCLRLARNESLDFLFIVAKVYQVLIVFKSETNRIYNITCE